MSVEGADKWISSNQPKENKELIEREEIKDTPFHLVKMDGKYSISMGRYILTTPDTKAATMKTLKLNWWDLVMKVIMLVVNEMMGREEPPAEIQPLKRREGVQTELIKKAK